jgi:hypothetical protein
LYTLAVKLLGISKMKVETKNSQLTPDEVSLIISKMAAEKTPFEELKKYLESKGCVVEIEKDPFWIINQNILLSQN